MTLVLTKLPGIPMIQPGDILAEIIQHGLCQAGITLQDGDILALAQKVVSKAEGRLVDLSKVKPSPAAFDLAERTGKDPCLIELILQESRQVLRVRSGVIIVEHRLGFICANAGIDHSNVSGPYGIPDDWVLLLPENPDTSAAFIRKHLELASGSQLGVLIIDSHGRAWRKGTVGVTIGLSGLPGLVDLRGQADLFGYKLKITELGAADELAAAASLMMGQSAEGTPIIHVRGFPYTLRDGCLQELIRPENLDLFR
jgi:coenzyme F420-0:L-glutamate ligase/coenzyme F420-1:gamma-L-glutamate ligase